MGVEAPAADCFLRFCSLPISLFVSFQLYLFVSGWIRKLVLLHSRLYKPGLSNAFALPAAMNCFLIVHYGQFEALTLPPMGVG